MKNKTQTYTIGLIAKRLGVCIDTLRLWEKGNLIHPSRSGKNRVYDLCDIERLEHIKYLLRKKKMNINAVREVINMKMCWVTKNCSAEERNNCIVYLKHKRK